MIRLSFFVKEGRAALLYENGALVRTLGAGRHRFWNLPWSAHREVVTIDLRERSSTIKNQEILTADKVAVRITLLVYFKVVDAVAAQHNVENFEERIYEDVQLAARRFLSGRALEQILTDRNEISDAVREDVRASALSYGVEIRRADVKDLVFPGNLRDIMNKAMEAEREGEALLIAATKKAEVVKVDQDTQARVSAQKLAAMEKEAAVLAAHPALVRLKELEVLREIGLRGGNTFHVGLDKLVKAEVK